MVRTTHACLSRVASEPRPEVPEKGRDRRPDSQVGYSEQRAARERRDVLAADGDAPNDSNSEQKDRPNNQRGPIANGSSD